MSLSKDQKMWIAAAVTPVVTAVATEMAVAAAKSLLEKLIVTNYEKRTLSSTKQMSPTIDTTSLDSRNTSGVQNDASMSHDNVQAQSGAVTAADTSAEATEAGTQASEVRTQAINTKLGTLTTNSTITQLN